MFRCRFCALWSLGSEMPSRAGEWLFSFGSCFRTVFPKKFLWCLDQWYNIFTNHQVYGDDSSVGVFSREYLDGLFTVEWERMLKGQFRVLCIFNDHFIVDQNIKTEVLVHDLDLMTVPCTQIVLFGIG